MNAHHDRPALTAAQGAALDPPAHLRALHRLENQQQQDRLASTWTLGELLFVRRTSQRLQRTCTQAEAISSDLETLARNGQVWRGPRGQVLSVTATLEPDHRTDTPLIVLESRRWGLRQHTLQGTPARLRSTPLRRLNQCSPSGPTLPDETSLRNAGYRPLTGRVNSWVVLADTPTNHLCARDVLPGLLVILGHLVATVLVFQAIVTLIHLAEHDPARASSLLGGVLLLLLLDVTVVGSLAHQTLSRLRTDRLLAQPGTCRARQRHLGLHAHRLGLRLDRPANDLTPKRTPDSLRPTDPRF